MKIPKRKQIIKYSLCFQTRDKRWPSYNERIVIVLKVINEHTAQVMCLADDDYHYLHNSYYINFNRPSIGNIKLLHRNDLPLYMDWNRTEAFNKILKGEL